MEFTWQSKRLFLCFILTNLLLFSNGGVFNHLDLTPVEASQLKDVGNVALTNLTANPDDNSIPTGFCKTWTGTVVTENSTWEEQHCRQCRCDGQFGAVCTHPSCDITFHPYLDTNCEQWSPDKCCCLRSTCVHNGVRYAADDWFLLTPSDPCTRCKCDPSDGVPQCVQMLCTKAQCVHASTIPGACCPVCLQGGWK